MKRGEAIAHAAGWLDPSFITIACNGMISRELYQQAERPSNFYMIGSMGLASSIALGIALSRPSKTVVVFDGDGNLLMNLGMLANIAASKAGNLYHLVFDNGVYASTGGQRTISSSVPLESIARASGYRRAARVETVPDLMDALPVLFAEPGPAMLLVTVDSGNEPSVGRVKLLPAQLTDRLCAELSK
jgi:sulfopyruvate decarboxylase subunit beta